MATPAELTALLSSLERAIQGDRRFFVAAKTDPTFAPFKAEVEGLLLRLNSQAKAHAERSLAQAQAAVAQMESWRSRAVSPDEYDAAVEALTRDRSGFSTGGYFGYLDAAPLAMEARTKAEAATSKKIAAMRQALRELEDKFASLETQINSLLQDRYLPAGSGEGVAADLSAARQHLRDGRQQSKSQNYESLTQAGASLTKSVEVLDGVVVSLTRRRDEAGHEARRRERIANAEAARSYALSRLSLATLILVAGTLVSFAAFIPWVITVSQAGDNKGELLNPGALGGAMLLFVASPLIEVIADRIWSVGHNRPGDKVQWNWLLLVFAWPVNPFVLLVLAIVVFVRGRFEIKRQYHIDSGSPRW